MKKEVSKLKTTFTVIALFLALFLICFSASAQKSTVTANLTAQSTACATANSCVTVNVDPNEGGAGFTLAGTWSGTVQFEGSADGGTTYQALNATPSNSSTAVTSATGNGVWQANVAGFTQVRIRCSTFSSGTIVATINGSSASARAGGGGGAGVGAGSGGAPALVVYVSPNCPVANTGKCFNAKFDVGVTFHASTTSGNNIVTCSDCKFQTGPTPAVVNQIFFANDNTASTNGNTCMDNPDITFGGLRQTTISSVDSDTQIHVVGNAGTTSTLHACAAWGDDDTTAINAAWAAGGCYSTVMLPNGNAFISAPIFQFSALTGCPTAFGFSPGPGQVIRGSTVGGTNLIPTPLFNFTSITTGGSASCNPISCTAAIGSPSIYDYEDFNVWGLGERCSGALVNTTLWDVGISTRVVNANGYGWCARGGGTTLIGVNINGGTDIYTWSGSIYFGSIVMSFSAPNIIFGNSYDAGNSSTLLGICPIQVGNASAAADNVLSTTNGLLGCLQVNANSTWNSIGTTISGNGDTSCVFIGTNAVVNLIANDIVCNNPSSNESGTTFFGTGGIMRASNSSHFANGTGSVILGVAANTFEDTNDNTFSGGAAIWNGLGTWLGSGSAHGTILATGNVAITTCGTSAASAFSGGSTKGQFTVTYAGTPGTACTATVTFPNAFPGAAPICTWYAVGGTNTLAALTLTNGATSRTSTAVTLGGATLTNGNTHILQYNCLNP